MTSAVLTLLQSPRRPRKPVAKPKPAPRVLIKSPAVGTWTLRKGENEDFATRLVLRPDATFTFIGPNFRSDGLYGIREGNLILNYRKVDGRAVTPDSIRLVLPLTMETFSFVLDGRTFAMRGKPTPVPATPTPPTTDGTTPPPPPTP